MQKQSSKNPHITREPFNRPPRILISPPQDTIEIPPPPAKEDAPPSTGLWQLTIALIMITSLLTVYLVINHAPIQQVTMLIPLSIMSILSPVGTLVAGMKKKKTTQQKNRANKKAYKQLLAQIREQLQKYADEQRQIALLSAPAPEMLEARIKDRSRLWERRPDDPDFLAARVGIGRLPSSVKINTSQVNAIDPASEDVRSLVRDFATVEDMPCTIAISKVKSLNASKHLMRGNGMRGEKRGRSKKERLMITVASLEPVVLADLRRHYEEAATAETRTRYHMVLLAKPGQRVPQIARLVERSEDTVARVLKRFLTQGLEAVPRQSTAKSARAHRDSRLGGRTAACH
jgi:Winged helix-turn helix